MKPLKLSDITMTTVLKLEAKAKNFTRKWLGLPWSLSSLAVFGRTTLQLPQQSISLGNKNKVRLIFELTHQTWLSNLPTLRSTQINPNPNPNWSSRSASLSFCPRKTDWRGGCRMFLPNSPVSHIFIPHSLDWKAPFTNKQSLNSKQQLKIDNRCTKQTRGFRHKLNFIRLDVLVCMEPGFSVWHPCM